MTNLFGMLPPDVSGALFQANNLGDVPDKAAARVNLNVPSIDDVMYSGVPVGVVVPYWGVSAPEGFLPCHGQTITSEAFPDLVEHLNPSGSTAVVPDLRGEFIRGWDSGRGVDVSRGMGTSQGEALQRHNHFLPTGTSSTVNPYPTLPDTIWANQTVNRNPTSTTEATTYPNPAYWNDGYNGTAVGNVGTFSAETRPRNVALMYCIKAYSVVKNVSSAVNIPGLISDHSALSADAARISYFLQNQSLNSNGYQKLPGGLILQWVMAVTSYTNGADTVTSLPIAFPSGVLSVNATFSGAGNGPFTDITTPILVKGWTNSSVTVMSNSGLNNHVHILAIGY